MMNGVLLINKPPDLTSHDVVLQIRKVFHTRKVGHAGTLDPFATGLLILCLGEATKIVRYLVDCDKEYVAVMKLGETTDTQDYTGQVVEQKAVPALIQIELAQVFTCFVGEIAQTPPMYSARRVQGKRLYQLAREGKTVERQTRSVTITALEILECTPPYIRFRVICSKGTYIRVLAHDIGQTLGCGAHLVELERTRIGQFSLQEACSLEQLSSMSQDHDRGNSLLSIDQALTFFPSATLDETVAKRLAHGTRIYQRTQEHGHLADHEELVRVYNPSGKFIALARTAVLCPDDEMQRQFQPVKVFNK